MPDLATLVLYTVLNAEQPKPSGIYNRQILRTPIEHVLSLDEMPKIPAWELNGFRSRTIDNSVNPTQDKSKTQGDIASYHAIKDDPDRLLEVAYWMLHNKAPASVEPFKTANGEFLSACYDSNSNGSCEVMINYVMVHLRFSIINEGEPPIFIPIRYYPRITEVLFDSEDDNEIDTKEGNDRYIEVGADGKPELTHLLP